MTKEEYEAKVEEIEDKRFSLSMKDRWSNSDYELDREYRTKLAQLKEDYENGRNHH